jgi:pyruvate kinase
MHKITRRVEQMTENKTKIVATMGPATASYAVLKDMILAGINICRLNFSHGDYDAVKETIGYIRQINIELGTNVGLLADLQGPKLRIGLVKDNGVELVTGREMVITTEECEGTAERIYITYPQFPRDVAVGDKVLIDDGKIMLQVLATNSTNEVKAVVVFGGILSSKKGVNLPNTRISLPCLTPKDKKDLDFALAQNVDWVALSFVRSVTDIVELKEIIKKNGGRARVIAKIEKPEAILEIDNIIDMTDGIMVARGDLGVELPFEQVPMIQKMLVHKCIAASKPIIIATQMMESMITNFAPTRAEVNDVANAVMDGADAVMLSGETSVGQYPVKVIEAMQRIISRVEEEESIYHREHAPVLKTQTFVSDSICYTACVMAHQANVSAIISMTNSGYTAFKLSSHRPKASIYIFTDNRSLLTSLSLVWGVKGFYYDKYESTDQTITDLSLFLKNENLVQTDDMVINIASMPMKERGRTNMLKLSIIH